MPAFLSDPPLAGYLVLIAAVLALAAVWLNKRDRRSLIGLAAAAVLLTLVFLIDRVAESPREEAVRRAKGMAAAADAKDPAAFVVHLADTIEYSGEGQPRKITKDQVRNSGLWGLLKQHSVHVAVWDFARADVKQPDDNTVEIGFMGKGETPDGKMYPVYVRATYAKQSDGTFKMTTFGTFSPTNRDEPLPIPNFP